MLQTALQHVHCTPGSLMNSASAACGGYCIDYRGKEILVSLEFSDPTINNY